MKNQIKIFIQKYRLNKNNLSPTILIDIFKRLGYDILYFNRKTNNEYINKIVTHYVLHKEISLGKTFTHIDRDIKLLFIRNNISEDELMHYMLHELGHIWLNHMHISNDEDRQEREADEFAVQVKLLLQRPYNFKPIISTFILISSIIVGGVYLKHYNSPVQQNNTYQIDIIKTPIPIGIDTDIVVITKTGDKYHKSYCYHVKNRTVVELAESKAIEAKYEPCTICFPELN